jgi:pseudaminic acid cytidylyltransferase
VKKIKRIAIIPARGGSKRIKNKNIKLFNKKPMISYPIKELNNTKIFNKVFVSTESKYIKKISEQFGAKVDFLRPKHLSKDKISLELVLKDVVTKFLKKGEIYDEIWLVYACNPLLKAQDIIKANKRFQKTAKTYPMMSVKEFEVPIEWAFKKEGGIYKSLDKKSLYKDSKKIKKKYFESATFRIYKKNHLLNNQKIFHYYGYLMEFTKALDIDSENDWLNALKLYKLENNIN